MAGIDSGNTNAAQNGAKNEGGEYPEQTCPMCGASVKLLPAHFRHDCEVTQGDE